MCQRVECHMRVQHLKGSTSCEGILIGRFQRVSRLGSERREAVMHPQQWKKKQGRAESLDDLAGGS